MMRFSGQCQKKDNRRAFTLIELLVAAVVLIVLLGIVLMITGSTGTAISRATVRLDAFATARSAFDLITRRLGQATLNPYYDYFDDQGRPASDPFYTSGIQTAFVPKRYGRQSDLQFLVQKNTQNHGYGQEVYFVAPLAYAAGADVQGASGLLNACGFYVQYASNQNSLPATVTVPHGRYRLMQAIQPTERLLVFPSVAQNDTSWLTDIGNAGTTVSRYASPLADNVLVFTVWPRLPEQDDAVGSQLTANYTYDSHSAPAADGSGQPETANQLPPVVQVTMVVLNEASAVRLGGTSSQAPAALEAVLLDADSNPKFNISSTSQHQADLNDLSARLTKLHADFEIFTSSVPMRESRWGTQISP